MRRRGLRRGLSRALCPSARGLDAKRPPYATNRVYAKVFTPRWWRLSARLAEIGPETHVLLSRMTQDRSFVAHKRGSGEGAPCHLRSEPDPPLDPRSRYLYSPCFPPPRVTGIYLAVGLGRGLSGSIACCWMGLWGVPGGYVGFCWGLRGDVAASVPLHVALNGLTSDASVSAQWALVPRNL